MKYSIVIPTYNHCDDLLRPCLETVFQYSNVSDIELIISANGCKDNTREYLGALKDKFNSLGLVDNLKIVWNDEPLGYAGATNAGIQVATCDLIVLLNNDVTLLQQPKNTWLNILEHQFQFPNCGISCIIKGPSEPAGRDFAVFFCVMIHRKVFDRIGLLNTEYGVGGGEDTEFCIEAENAGFEVREVKPKEWSDESSIYVGGFPIYHRGEGTMHDTNLVPNYNDIHLTNSLILAKKYNPKWYQWRLSNYWERAVYFKGDHIDDREVTRYKWAAQNILGTKVFELGCTSGYGLQFLPEGIEYTGLDYDKRIVEVAYDQAWREGVKFVHADINEYELDFYDTIIAFEVIEHLDTGLEIVKKLQKHCNRLLITVPMLEPPGKWGPHHKLHLLDESFFPGFKFQYIAPDGRLLDQPVNRGDTENINLMICRWDNPDAITEVAPTNTIGVAHRPSAIPDVDVELPFAWMKDQDPEIYKEVIQVNQYNLTPSRVQDRVVIDIGANIGAFSLLAASMGAKKVLSVEPVGATYYLLCKNIQRAGNKNIIPLRNLVADTTGELCKVSLNQNAGANSMYNVSEQYEVVKTISFSKIVSALDSNNILLKLDCEGAEYDILMNASYEDMQNVNEILIEMHTDLHPKFKGREILEDKLKEFGFKNVNTNQVYWYDINDKGETQNWREAPFSNQHWTR